MTLEPSSVAEGSVYPFLAGFSFSCITRLVGLWAKSECYHSKKNEKIYTAVSREKCATSLTVRGLGYIQLEAVVLMNTMGLQRKDNH